VGSVDGEACSGGSGQGQTGRVWLVTPNGFFESSTASRKSNVMMVIMDGEAMGSSMPEYTTWRVEDCDEQKGGMGVNP